MMFIKHFEPNESEQKGIFHYLLQKYKEENATYISVYSNARDTCYVYTPIDDTFDGTTRKNFKSPINTTTDIYIRFNQYYIYPTHVAIRYLQSNCYTTSWKIYDYTEGNNELIANQEITKCGNRILCDIDNIEIIQFSSKNEFNSIPPRKKIGWAFFSGIQVIRDIW